ncbi:MAG: threonine synthase [Gammaproteobacteria bacterium]|nr:threonine synthase [Gammaproteobacteria bacterium]
MQFTETRGNDGSYAEIVSFASAILSPVASFDGIYSPKQIPVINEEFLQSHLSSDYKELALALLSLCDIDIEPAILQEAVDLYDNFDDSSNPAPVARLEQAIYVSELYHGPTRAFKDMALQPFGKILSTLAQTRREEFLILTATSGDTGPAALDTFRNRDNIRVACLYPDGGTSDVQRLQMVTESASNLKVIGIKGNFDDAQAALKSLLSSDSFNQRLNELNISLSAANSVNFGRIMFQIIYQFHSYLELVRQQAITMDEWVNLHIPSGNFGNALGAYYASQMGLPVERIYIASNANNVLTEWVNTGRYDTNSRSLIATNSPAMDILKSSNVERVLFDLFGSNRTRELMRSLDEHGFYQLKEDETTRIQAIFSAAYCSDEEGQSYIKGSFENGYLMDPHTATCLKTCEIAAATNDLVNIVYATAEWTKFAPTINQAITGKVCENDLEALQSIANIANVEIPHIVQSLFDKPVSHADVVAKSQIEARIMAFLR